MPRQDSHVKAVSKELALNVTFNYLMALQDVADGYPDPYQALLCDHFQVVDPVGTTRLTSTEKLLMAFREREDLMMPKGFLLAPHAITIAQDYQYAAAFSSMLVSKSESEDVMVSRSDLLTISPLGCIMYVDSYWSGAGSLLNTPASARHNTTKAAIHRYLKALHELGTGQSLDYFSQFADEFEVHDPFGTAPMKSVAELQEAIPKLAALVAPKGFTVDVEGVTVSANPRWGSAHLVLNIVGGISIDIIDVFDITKQGKVRILKAVWHIS